MLFENPECITADGIIKISENEDITKHEPSNIENLMKMLETEIEILKKER